MELYTYEYVDRLVKEKSELERLKYYLSDEAEKRLAGFKIVFTDNTTIDNIPLSARVLVRTTLLKEIDRMIKVIDNEIKEA